MPVPSRITDLSATAADNSPAGTDTVGPGLDDYLRGIQAVIKGDLATKGADIASATTTDLGAVQGIAHDITGTTTITGFGAVAAGVWKVLKFEGALTLTHNATSLILPGGENITTADGDTAIFISEGSGNWRCLNYSPVAINPAKTVSTDESQTLTNKTLTSPVIQGTVGAGAGLTLPALTLSGTVTSNGQSFSGTIANLGTVTTIDLNGGTIDGTTIGGSAAAAGSFTTGSFSSVINNTAGSGASSYRMSGWDALSFTGNALQIGNAFSAGTQWTSVDTYIANTKVLGVTSGAVAVTGAVSATGLATFGSDTGSTQGAQIGATTTTNYGGMFASTISSYTLGNAIVSWDRTGGSVRLNAVTGGTAGISINNVDALLVNASGNLGLGVTPVPYAASNRTFHIDGGANASEIRLTNNTTGTGAANGGLIQQSGNTLYIWNVENAAIDFGTNNTSKMTLDASGNLKTNGNQTQLTVTKTASNLASGATLNLFYIGSYGAAFSATLTIEQRDDVNGNLTLKTVLVSGFGGSSFDFAAVSSVVYSAGQAFTINSTNASPSAGNTRLSITNNSGNTSTTVRVTATIHYGASAVTWDI